MQYISLLITTISLKEKVTFFVGNGYYYQLDVTFQEIFALLPLSLLNNNKSNCATFRFRRPKVYRY